MNWTACVPALLVAALSPPAWADVYIATAPDGGVALTNVPAERGYRLLLRERSAAAAPTVRQAAQSRRPFQALVDEAAREHGLDPDLLHAVIAVESAYDSRAVSRAGAMGLMQLMPATARRWGVDDPYDPRQNLRGGASELGGLLQAFDRDLRLSLAAYNAGETAVRRHGNRVPPIAETRRYVGAVLQRYERQRDRAAVAAGPAACGPVAASCATNE